jgi:DNA-binding transcriptional MerR regulator
MAAAIAGVTPKTLRNWDERGFLHPSTAAPGRGFSRIYSFRDLIAIRVAARLRDDGIPLQSIRRVVQYLRARKGLSTTTTDVLAGTSLITDGHDVFEVQGEVTLSALRRPGQRTLHMVPFDEIVTELQAAARAALRVA